MNLLIIRGLPGSGKTTLAGLIGKGIKAEIVAADDFFTDESGKYNFKPDQLGRAHRWCEEQTEKFMQEGKPVIVHNTFTTESELARYLELGKQYNYKITSLIVENRHGNESVHNVPIPVMQKMKQRFSVSL